MKIYVAGGMRGLKDFNIPAFDSATKKLRAEGHTVFNPVEQDCARDGLEHDASLEDKVAAATRTNIREALGDDLRWICQEADCVALLPGWENSKGARAERATALALDLLVFEL